MGRKSASASTLREDGEGRTRDARPPATWCTERICEMSAGPRTNIVPLSPPPGRRTNVFPGSTRCEDCRKGAPLPRAPPECCPSLSQTTKARAITSRCVERLPLRRAHAKLHMKERIPKITYEYDRFVEQGFGPLASTAYILESGLELKAVKVSPNAKP